MLNTIIKLFLILLMFSVSYICVAEGSTLFYALRKRIDEHKKQIIMEEEDVVQDDDTELLVKQAQKYDIEDFRIRMERMRKQQDQDEDGLFDVPQQKTRDEMGYSTGVELPPGD